MYYDSFDIVEAHYAYYCDYHSGQGSIGYEQICRIKYRMQFKPSPLFTGYNSLSENGRVIYDNLVSQNKPA